MRLLHRTHASFDDPNLVSRAGLVPVMALAQRQLRLSCGCLHYGSASTLTANGSSDNTGTSASVHRPTAHATEATWRVSRFSPPRQRLGHRGQRLRLPVRVGDRTGHSGGILALAGPATRSYSTFMRLATSCSSPPGGWEQARRPPEPRDQYRRLTHAHATATGYPARGSGSNLIHWTSNGP